MLAPGAYDHAWKKDDWARIGYLEDEEADDARGDGDGEGGGGGGRRLALISGREVRGDLGSGRNRKGVEDVRREAEDDARRPERCELQCPCILDRCGGAASVELTGHEVGWVLIYYLATVFLW